MEPISKRNNIYAKVRRQIGNFGNFTIDQYCNNSQVGKYSRVSATTINMLSESLGIPPLLRRFAAGLLAIGRIF